MSRARKCTTLRCDEPATKEWGIDARPVCAACDAELHAILATIREAADERDADIARRRIDE